MQILQCEISYELATKLKLVEDMTGKRINLVDYVNNFVDRYANAKGDVKPEEAFMLPLPYEISSVESMCRLAGEPVPTVEEIIRLRKHRVYILDDNIFMLGKPYCKVYDPSRDDIIKCPLEKIEKISK